MISDEHTCAVPVLAMLAFPICSPSAMGQAMRGHGDGRPGQSMRVDARHDDAGQFRPNAAGQPMSPEMHAVLTRRPHPP